MRKRLIRIALASACFFLFGQSSAGEAVKGIFLTQQTAQDRVKLAWLISQAKRTGINTFVIDLYQGSERYRLAIQQVKESGIRYIPRIVMFPYGGVAADIQSPAYWETKYRLVELALGYGADEIQLDYIRYASKQKASPENARDILAVLKWFKGKLAPSGVPLQIDVFGEVSFGPSVHIGQDLPLFAETIDAACPMLYPSHFEPFRERSQKPYETVSSSLAALYAQFQGPPPFKVYAYIEMYNYRYPMTYAQRLEYVEAELKAVVDSQADGWFAWSAGNKYDLLFELLSKKAAPSSAN